MSNTALASLVFWVVCAVPLIGGLYWLIRKDKDKRKGIWGVVILGLLIIAAIIVILYVTKDFNTVFEEMGK